jgi:ABC-2 type transport system ATP-binding protein
MTIRPGEIFGFLGPNGAGKTTTIRTVLDLLHPTRGSARVFGLDSRRDRSAIYARLGNLPGDFGYDDRRSGREIVAFFAALQAWPTSGARTRARSASRRTSTARSASSTRG